MPTLDFKGKQHIYAHHLTVPTAISFAASRGWVYYEGAGV